MQRVRMFAVTLVVLLIGAAAQAAGVRSIEVGSNPWIEPTGGTGTVEAFDEEAQTGAVAKRFTQLGDIPVILNRGASSGVETFHLEELVRNDTGVGWTGFHLAFENIDANELLLEFLDVSNPTGEWTGFTTGANRLSFSGFVPDGDEFEISFDLRITDQVGAFAIFGLNETPSVPEPDSLALIGAGLAGIGAARRRAREHARRG